MNEVSIHASYIFGNKQKSLWRKTYQKAEELGSKRGQIEGPTKTREVKLTHSNWQISKIFMYHYKGLVINRNVKK